MGCVRDTGLGQKRGGAEIAGHECADDQQRWCLTTGDKVVFEVLDLATGIIAHRDVHEDADQDAGRVDVDVSFFLLRCVRLVRGHEIVPCSRSDAMDSGV